MVDVMTTDEAAEFLGYAPMTLRQLRYRNRGPLSFKRGGRIVYLREDLEDFLAAQRRATTRGSNE